MKIKQLFQRWFKLRFAIIYPFGIFVAIFANSDDDSMRTSLWWIIPGLLIRLWANGYAIKMEKLTTSGPYAFVRNPLYLGTMFIAIGFAVMLRTHYIGALFVAFMALTYYQTIKKEERMLEERFKEEYINYTKRVPAIIPTIFPYRSGEKWSFSFKRFLESKEYKTFLWIAIVVISFYLKEELLVEHEPVGSKILCFMGIALALGIVDLIGELIKLRKRIKEK